MHYLHAFPDKNNVYFEYSDDHNYARLKYET